MSCPEVPLPGINSEHQSEHKCKCCCAALLLLLDQLLMKNLFQPAVPLHFIEQ